MPPSDGNSGNSNTSRSSSPSSSSAPPITPPIATTAATAAIAAAQAPTLPWRISSTLTIAVSGLIAHTFLFGASRTEVRGLDGFLRLLDERADVGRRERGLITGRYRYSCFCYHFFGFLVLFYRLPISFLLCTDLNVSFGRVLLSKLSAVCRVKCLPEKLLRCPLRVEERVVDVCFCPGSGLALVSNHISVYVL